MPTIPSAAEARAFAEAWVAAWNAHDLEAIVAHYAEAAVLTSPVAARRTGDPAGKVRGKAALRGYFGEALKAYPGLRFDLRDVLVGVEGLTLLYRGVGRVPVAESMRLDPDGKVAEAWVAYGEAPPRHAPKLP